MLQDILKTRSSRKRLILPAVTLAATVALALSGCTSSPAKTASSSSSASGDATSTGPIRQGGSVTIANLQGGNYNCQFNPLNPVVSNLSIGFIYEPLVFMNILQNGKTTPMLASNYSWASDSKTVTFTIRKGVKWSDGQPLTPQDVVFTFDELKKYPALDTYSLWSGDGLQSVTSAGDTVTLSFSGPAKVYFYNFANLVPIIPEHIWAKPPVSKDPATWADTSPVGTGPFMLKSCQPNTISYRANPNYWMPNEPHIQSIQMPTYLSNQPANLDLANGVTQWAGQYIPNIQQQYVSKDPAHHQYWFAPVNNVEILPNLDPSHVTGKLKVRQAIASAIDRPLLAKLGESGYEPAANQTGIVTPTFSNYLDKSLLASSGYDKANPGKAAKLLSSLGYSKANPLKLTILTQAGNTDWDSTLSIMKQELAAANIDLTVQDLGGQAYNTRLFDGDFDLVYDSTFTGYPAPYYELRILLYSKGTAPIGKPATSDYERYRNPAVDKLFDEYASATPAEQVTITKEIEKYMVQDVPIIPVTEGVDWYEYNTKSLAGWPTKSDPYAQGSPYIAPDLEMVLLHLHEVSGQ